MLVKEINLFKVPIVVKKEPSGDYKHFLKRTSQLFDFVSQIEILWKRPTNIFS